MEDDLQNFLKLNGKISEINSDNFIYELEINAENIDFINKLYNDDYIETLKIIDGKIINIDSLHNLLNQVILIEFVTADIKKIGFYLSLNEFILDNRFAIPVEFYISQIDFLNSSSPANKSIEKYKTLTMLIQRLISKAKFIAEENIKILCLVQDNSFVEIAIENIVYEDYFDSESIPLMNQYIDDIDSYKEKRTIYLKELIDFLSNKIRAERFNELILYFSEFYERCDTSFEYYLSNFSFNKIKLELDNSVLEYSKNIRSIINDSQSKLIAVPAAFAIGASQVNYSDPFSIKNILVIFSSILFSYIISIFIQNQKNALEIIADNLGNYKSNYKRSKSTEFEEEKDLENLSELINNSYKKTEHELDQQNIRLNILQYCNWGISIALFISILIIYIIQNEVFYL